MKNGELCQKNDSNFCKYQPFGMRYESILLLKEVLECLLMVCGMYVLLLNNSVVKDAVYMQHGAKHFSTLDVIYEQCSRKYFCETAKKENCE